jgi:hypothetical protein
VQVLVGLRLLVERREGADGRGADGHRVRILRQRLEEPPEVLVQQRVVRDLPREVRELGAARQFTVQQQPGDLVKAGMGSKVFDRKTAIRESRAFLADGAEGGASGDDAGQPGC